MEILKRMPNNNTSERPNTVYFKCASTNDRSNIIMCIALLDHWHSLITASYSPDLKET